MIEREVRYRINEDIKKKIIDSSIKIDEKYTYTDLCMGKYGFDSLDKLGYIVRLRNKDGKCIMESKKRVTDNSWEEVVVPLATMKNGFDFLKNIGLDPYLYIKRTREIRKINEAKIFIDEIDLLGTFVEFEMEEGFNFSDLEYYLSENGIENIPEKLYGDIFKEKMKDSKFKDEFDLALNEFLKSN